MRRLVLSLLASWLLVEISSAQSQYLTEIYGNGVHAFFRCEKFEALEQFDLAINNGLQDPRVYYFRALINLELGDCFRAEEDIRTAVMFELRGLGTFDIGRALERVQGPERLELERLRLLARLELSRQFDTDEPPMAPDGMLPGRDRSMTIPDSPFTLDEQLRPDATDLDLDADREPPADRVPRVPPPVEDEFPAEVDKPDPFVDDDDPFDQQPDAAPDMDDSGFEFDNDLDADPFGDDDPFAD